VAWLTERLGLRRPLAAWSTGFGVWLLGLGVCLSFNHWSGYTLFGLNLFELLDFLTSRIMMPLSGLAIALFVGSSMTRARVMDEMQLPEAGFNLWYRVLRYLAPLGILLVFLHVLGWLG
jgi:NSS family neurotransmitter:Na+ symporter